MNDQSPEAIATAAKPEANLLTPTLGAPFAGGHYGGRVRVGDAILAIAWAPKALGETRLPWMIRPSFVLGCGSLGDSTANTRALAAVGSPLGAWAGALRIAGHADWVVPARDVLELAYRHFKPTRTDNFADGIDGMNGTSVPGGGAYARKFPQVTQAPAFAPGGPEAFEETWYWSSTQYAEAHAKGQGFDTGEQLDCGKKYHGLVRAVRLVRLNR